MKLLLALALLTISCTCTLWSQTYSIIAPEGKSPAVASLVTIPAGQTYRWGDPIHNLWCDPITTKTSVTIRAYNFPADSIPAPTCLIKGVPVKDGDISPGNLKELDGLQGATAWIASVVTPPATVALPVTVPATGGTVIPPPTVNSITFSADIVYNGAKVHATCVGPAVVTP